MTNSNKTSQKTRFLFVIVPILLGLAYLYWWLTQPAEKRLSSLEMETPSPTKVPPPAVPDDLTKIKGIGPKISEALYSQGICFYSQIALMSETDLREFLSEAGMRLAKYSTWPKQARLAALGEWERLGELQAAI
ncbi:MAG: hypothetical protein DRI56_08805 [Chloroflexota bacterium]|nr:MAG: hypothetical protein DRI56_08805 [Chloroflexota bacterium]